MTRIKNKALATALTNAFNGSNTISKHYHEHMLALLEEADKSFPRKHERRAAADCLDGLRIYQSFLDQITSLAIQPSAAQVRAIESLAVELANRFGMMIDSIVALKYRENSMFPLESIHEIALLYQMHDIAFTSYHMPDRQRVEAHFRDAMAAQFLGDYLSKSGNREYMLAHLDPDQVAEMDRRPDDLLEDAVANYFYT